MEEVLPFNSEPDKDRRSTEVGDQGSQMESTTLESPEERGSTREVENESDSGEEAETEKGKEKRLGVRESMTESARELVLAQSKEEMKEEEEEEKEEQLRDEDRWRSNDGSLADDEGDEDEDEKGYLNGVSEKTCHAFTPLVTIVRPASQQLELNGDLEEPEKTEPAPDWTWAGQSETLPQHLQTTQEKRSWFVCCGEVVRLSLSLVAAAVLFPLLVWGGFELLPFDPPALSSSPFRLLYTLRCAFFATFPIVLGVLVQGVCRLKFGALKPLYVGRWGVREVVCHSNYVRDSLHLFLLYFIQLAVLSTYITQDMLKLLPLLTIIFVFGRLIYWVCVVFGSSVRALGFGLSFLPMLAVIGANLYYVCSSQGQEAVFDVTATTAPPPKPRWWG